MVEAEKVNHRVALKRVEDNIKKLNNSNKTFEDIFRISFSHPDYTIFNIVESQSIKDISYGYATKMCKKYAKLFSSKIDKNELYVGLLLKNCPEWIYCFYGLLMSNHIPVLLSTQSDDQNNLYVINELSVKCLITDSNSFSNFKKINPFLCSSDLKDEITECRWADEVVFITSGTTGNSKIVSYTGKELTAQINNASMIIKKFPIFGAPYKGFVKHLVVLPFYHVFGFIAVFLWFTFFNVTFIIPENLTPLKLRQACLLGQPTLIFAVPAFWETVAKKIAIAVRSKHAIDKFEKAINFSLKYQKIFGINGTKFVREKLFANYLSEIFGSSIQCCISGGAHLSNSTLRLINGLGYPLVNGYGSTEIGITSFASFRNIKNRLEPSIGLPLSSVQYKLEKNNNLTELSVNGDSLFSKSFENKHWIIRDKNQFYPTHDIAIFANNKFYLKGRIDEIYVAENGENYSLPMIEEYLPLRHSSDYLFVEEDKNLILLISYEEKITRFCIDNDLHNLFTHLLTLKLKISKVFITYLSFPKANGVKLKRNDIKNIFATNKKVFEKIELDNYKKAPEIEKLDKDVLDKVIEIIKKYFPNKEVRCDSDFYQDLSGDSMVLLSIIADVEDEFKINISLENFASRSPKELANYVTELLSL